MASLDEEAEGVLDVLVVGGAQGFHAALEPEVLVLQRVRQLVDDRGCQEHLGQVRVDDEECLPRGIVVGGHLGRHHVGVGLAQIELLGEQAEPREGAREAFGPASRQLGVEVLVHERPELGVGLDAARDGPLEREAPDRLDRPGEGREVGEVRGQGLRNDRLGVRGERGAHARGAEKD